MRLADYLSQHGLTVTVFGERIGVSHASVVRYNNGQRFPSQKTMQKIVDVTAGAVQPNDFYDLPDHAAPAPIPAAE